MDKIILNIFTDPMMGITYECEPIFRRLENHYGDEIECRYVMAGLVRDVADFMTPDELALGPEAGIRKYCRRLAGIYKSEESIGGLPIHMDGFHLFDADHRSSYPLDIAYKAAQLASPEKADDFLHALQQATIIEARQTTREEELVAIAKAVGIEEDAFRRYFYDGSAASAFKEDLAFTRSLGIYTLPSFLLQYKKKSVLIRRLIGVEEFKAVIERLKG